MSFRSFDKFNLKDFDTLCINLSVMSLPLCVGLFKAIRAAVNHRLKSY